MVDTIVYVPEYPGKTVREYRVTEERNHTGDIIYLCRSLSRPFVGYSFTPAKVGSEVFLDIESAKDAMRQPLE